MTLGKLHPGGFHDCLDIFFGSYNKHSVFGNCYRFNIIYSSENIKNYFLAMFESRKCMFGIFTRFDLRNIKFHTVRIHFFSFWVNLILIGETGFEPARCFTPSGYQSLASANFATPPYRERGVNDPPFWNLHTAGKTA